MLGMMPTLYMCPCKSVMPAGIARLPVVPGSSRRESAGSIRRIEHLNLYLVVFELNFVRLNDLKRSVNAESSAPSSWLPKIGKL